MKKAHTQPESNPQLAKVVKVKTAHTQTKTTPQTAAAVVVVTRQRVQDPYTADVVKVATAKRLPAQVTLSGWQQQQDYLQGKRCQSGNGRLGDLKQP